MPENLSNGSASAEGEQGIVATAVRELIEGVRAGEPLRAGGLILVPLLPTTEQVKRHSGYLPLEEALRRNLVTITEQAQARVPELTATSTAETPVVLVGGEQVIGGLQNRVLNTTILVAAHMSQQIPVTCVEAGRWHESSAYYASYDTGAPTSGESAQQAEEAYQAARKFHSEETAYAKLRHLHAKAVTSSLSSGGGHSSDQGAVWSEVSARMMSTGSFSPSHAMDALYKVPERANKLKETVDALKRPEGALGFVAMLGSDVLGAEVFTDESLADAYWEKLARSYAVEALDANKSGDPDAEHGDVANTAINVGETQLLADALAADIQVHPSPGLGKDARLVGSHVSGAGLVYDGAVVHLSLFPESAESGEGESTPTPTQRHYGGHRQTNI
jgi:hypothetical protein